MKPHLRRLVAGSLERSVQRLVAANPQLKIVAVAGSVGKTSTKTAIATVLAEKYRVLVHDGNYNSEVGLPMAIFELKVPSRITDAKAWLAILGLVRRKLKAQVPYDVMVLELGTDHPGEIGHFMTYLKPDIGVITAVTPEHMEFFDNLDAVAKEELDLATGSKSLIVNDDAIDIKYRKTYLATHADVATYGKAGVVHWAAGDDMNLGTETIHVMPHVIGDHSRSILLAAAAVAAKLGLSNDQIIAGIAKVRPVAGRMNPFDGVNGSHIIDDTYNSSPDAVLAALTTLEAFSKGRKIAILGSMNELGEGSAGYHREVGAATAKLDLLLTIGIEANDYLGPAAVKAGLAKDRWHAFTSPYEAGKWLASELKAGDWVLAKGSQNGVFAEEAAKQLLADPKDAVRLVRQSSDWLAKKAAGFEVQ